MNVCNIVFCIAARIEESFAHKNLPPPRDEGPDDIPSNQCAMVSSLSSCRVVMMLVTLFLLRIAFDSPEFLLLGFNLTDDFFFGPCTVFNCTLM